MCKRRYNIHICRLASIHSTHMSKRVQFSRHNYAMNNYKLSIQVWNVTRVLLKKSGFDEWKMKRPEVKFQKTNIIEKDTEYCVYEYGNVNTCRDILGFKRGNHCQINIYGAIFCWLCEGDWSTHTCWKTQLGRHGLFDIG